MKRTVSILGCVLFALVALYPLGATWAACTSYEFELFDYSAYAAITALIAIITVVISIIVKEPCENRVCAILLAIAAPISLYNALLFLFESSTGMIPICMIISVACNWYLAARHGKPLVLKIISLTLSIAMILPIGFFVFLIVIFGDLSQNTVVKTVSSPNGAYYAEVIDNNQGAMGGDTLVEVYKNKEINAVVFKIQKDSQRVYTGEWGEFYSMEIYWKDDKCLVIDSTEYIIE